MFISTLSWSASRLRSFLYLGHRSWDLVAENSFKFGDSQVKAEAFEALGLTFIGFRA